MGNRGGVRREKPVDMAESDACPKSFDLPKEDLEHIRKYRAETIAALFIVLNNWVKGKYSNEGLPPVPGNEGDKCLKQLQSLHWKFPFDNNNSKSVKIRDEIYSILIRNNVHKHYSTTASHRTWIMRIYTLTADVANIKLPANMKELAEIHDLSKYGIPEALGYGVMFGKTGAYRQLDEVEKDAWLESLNSHYANNPHHPEYCRGEDMPNEYAQESLIDMLASRTERELKGEVDVTPTLLFTIHEQYYKRYTPHDKEVVMKLVDDWKAALEQVVGSQNGSCKSRVKTWEQTTGLKLHL